MIDLGRADLRPPTEDFVRLAGQDFDRESELEAAFLEGYGVDPRTPEQWRRDLLGQAVGTAVWALAVRVQTPGNVSPDNSLNASS